MVRGFAAATRVAAPARPAAAVAAPPQPRRAVAARVLRTSASEKVAADLSVVGTNGSLSALVSVRAALSLSRARPPPSLLCSTCAEQRLVRLMLCVFTRAFQRFALCCARRFLIPSTLAGWIRRVRSEERRVGKECLG